MLSVHFYLRAAETCSSPDKKLVIYYQLEIEGQKRDTAQSTKIKIPHRFWWAYPKNRLHAPTLSKDGQPQYVVQSFYESEHINEQLAQIRDGYRELFKSMQTFSEDVPSYNELRKCFDPATRTIKRKVIPTFVSLMKQMIEEYEIERGWSRGTATNYCIRQNNIIEFFSEKKYSKLLINEVKYKHIKELLSWMKQQKDEMSKQKFGIDHCNKHATLMKTVIDYAVNEELIQHSPIAKLNLTYSEIQPPKYLGLLERKAIENCTVKSVEKIRDIAVFLMHTGFSYIDFLDLKSEHLQGACWKKQREKSSVYSLPPLLPEAAIIISKYGSIEKIPRLHITDANKALKYLGDYCKINTETVGFELTTSVFRETFASMMENEYMIPRSSIKFMMGHKTEKQLANYSTVQGGRLLHELEKHAKAANNPILKKYSEFLQSFRMAS
ncbi:phage integrase SAM-like domain-containing protein [Emticicia sp. W12TSBA100-4]|uniref:tyrosine-type recombinase/integrase n=1 Tax=Emticicia sp. W12TSBA100-4 TaxID=3160965 RepID=UPI0033063682